MPSVLTAPELNLSLRLFDVDQINQINQQEKTCKPTNNEIEKKILNADAYEVMQQIASNSIDLVLTDPPYAISRPTGFKSVKNGLKRFAVSMDFGDWDQTEIDLKRLSQDLFRIIKPSGTVIVFYDLWKITNLASALEVAGFKQLRFIEWVKTNPVPLNSKRNYLTNSREIAVLAVKGGKPVFNDSYHNGIYSYPIPNGKGRDKRIHPTQKPLSLFEDLIEKHSQEGAVVFDPFLGSGTTAVAAIGKNRDFFGCEKDEEYYKAAKNRILNFYSDK